MHAEIEKKIGKGMVKLHLLQKTESENERKKHAFRKLNLHNFISTVTT